MPPEFTFKGAALGRADKSWAALDYGGPKNTVDNPVASDQQKYRWVRSPDYQDEFGQTTAYWTNIDTKESVWDEPDEPYWLWSTALQGMDVDAGLQQPEKDRPRKDPREGYTGYLPSRDGNYKDWLAKQGKDRQTEEERAVAGPAATAAIQPSYDAQMTLNARTGHAQAKGPGAEHHSDSAKSGRQLNAYFDADTAANAHGGRSLKEERQKQVLSKKQVAEYKKKASEKKRQKELKFYKN